MNGKVKVAKRGVKVEVCIMEPDTGRPGQNPDPKPTPSRRPASAPVRSPLVPPPTSSKIRSSPVVISPVTGKPERLPMDAPQPKRRLNRVGIVLALAIGLGTIPFTIRFQKDRLKAKTTSNYNTNYEIPLEKRQWRMHGLVDDTEKQVIAQFGPPYIARNFNMSDGAFAGPAVGLKKFYPKTLPDYDARTKSAEAVWAFPEYVVIREVVWQLPDSYLTIWMREPRAEIDISDDKGVTTLPTAPEGGGDWVVIDNFRVGKDLVKTPPTASPAAGKSP